MSRKPSAETENRHLCRELRVQHVIASRELQRANKLAIDVLLARTPKVEEPR